MTLARSYFDARGGSSTKHTVKDEHTWDKANESRMARKWPNESVLLTSEHELFSLDVGTKYRIKRARPRLHDGPPSGFSPVHPRSQNPCDFPVGISERSFNNSDPWYWLTYTRNPSHYLWWRAAAKPFLGPVFQPQPPTAFTPASPILNFF